MACSELLSLHAPKACSGKCQQGECAGGTSSVWVAAASEGMLVLYRKAKSGKLVLKRHGASAVAPTIESFRDALTQAETAHQISQLILVGAASDLAWMHMAVPPTLGKYVAAEISYPLLPAWFKTPNAQDLATAIERVLN
ncbi:MAG: hypothetical protein K2Q01_04400 [Rickettsiales bacterium]|nr:hypothetical protein [Rickettsiales bacterium]